MSKTTIQWTNYTVNFWHGCKKVSDGCKFCYMFRDKERYGQEPTTVIQRDFKKIRNELKKLKAGTMIFTCSWSDFFIKEADEWRKEAWQIIKENPHLIWQILTKRPERILNNIPEDFNTYQNVWLGVSIENEANKFRALHLSEIKKIYPNITAFISFEPLIGEIYHHRDFWKCADWVIIGGESGNENGKYKYRKCELKWIESLVSAFQDRKVFVKQLGTYLAKELKLKDRFGGDIEEFPEHLKVREFPKEVKNG